MADKLKLILIESNQMMSRGIVSMLAAQPEIEVAATTEHGSHGIKLATQYQPDIILAEMRNSDLCGLDFVQQMREKSLSAKIIFLIEDARDIEISRSLKLGALGFVMKNATESDWLKAIHQVAQGRSYLPPEVSETLRDNLGQEDFTPSEKRIMDLLVEGQSNREIAAQLEVSENTVRTHIKSIFEKLQVSDRTAAVTTGIRRGLVRVDF